MVTLCVGGGGGERDLINDTLKIGWLAPSLSFGMTRGEVNYLRLRLHSAIYRPNSFVLMPRYCANLKAIRYESTSLNRIVADKSHRVIVALGWVTWHGDPLCWKKERCLSNTSALKIDYCWYPTIDLSNVLESYKVKTVCGHSISNIDWVVYCTFSSRLVGLTVGFQQWSIFRTDVFDKSLFPPLLSSPIQRITAPSRVIQPDLNFVQKRDLQQISPSSHLSYTKDHCTMSCDSTLFQLCAKETCSKFPPLLSSPIQRITAPCRVIQLDLNFVQKRDFQQICPSSLLSYTKDHCIMSCDST